MHNMLSDHAIELQQQVASMLVSAASDNVRDVSQISSLQLSPGTVVLNVPTWSKTRLWNADSIFAHSTHSSYCRSGAVVDTSCLTAHSDQSLTPVANLRGGLHGVSPTASVYQSSALLAQVVVFEARTRLEPTRPIPQYSSAMDT